MVGLSSDVLQVKEFLKSQHMNVLDEWLEGCVNFFLEEKRYSKQQLNDAAKGQWLLSDLTEICPGSLPTDLNTSVKAQLDDSYVLQVNYVLDIGTPAYQQLQKLTNVDTSNIQVTTLSNQTQFSEPPSQRMLKLILTDGIQQVSGMEYKPMRNLSTELMPGTKVLIKGPVECRRGVLVLEEKHLTVLGGEVEDLLRSNQYKQVLTRIVERNLERNPNCPASRSRFTREAVPSDTNSQTQNVPQTPSVRNETTNQTTPQEQLHRDTEVNDLSDDMFQDDFDFESINRVEMSAANPPRPQPPTPQPVGKKMKLENRPQSTKQLQMNAFGFAEDVITTTRAHHTEPDQEEELFFKMMEMGANDFEDEYPLPVGKDPFVFIKQLTETLYGRFVVKAQVVAITNKLKFKNGDWELKCKICDGTSYLDVDVSSPVLSSLVGYTPSEMSRLKHQVAANPDLKQKIVQGLSEAHRKLQILDLLMEILYKPSGPCIVNMAEFTPEDLVKMKDRVETVS